MERTPEEKQKIIEGLETYIEEHHLAAMTMRNAIEQIDKAIDIVSRYSKSFTYHALAEAQGKMTVAGCYIDHEIDAAKKALENIQKQEGDKLKHED
jgi:uncharacterized membrane-anchored protein YjiN (DUF445 family)